jgi:uncharacterized protein (DUF2237 family)
LSSIMMILLIVFVAQASANGVATNQTGEAQGSLDKLMDKLLDRVLKLVPSNHTGLDGTMLGKPGHLTISPRASLRSLPPALHARATSGGSVSAWTGHLPQFHREATGVPKMTSHWRSSRFVSTRAEPDETYVKPKPFEGEGISVPLNVLGGDLASCCQDCRGSGYGTGFYRDGFCQTGLEDPGRHTVCIEATADFLEFSSSIGIDLDTPVSSLLFPGIRPGDRWCLCAERWLEAYEAGRAPPLYLEATHEKTLKYVDLPTLMRFAKDAEEAEADIAKLNAMRSELEKMMSKSG